MEEAVIHYINSHPTDEAVHVDANNLALNVQDDGGNRVAVMQSQTYSTSLCRQVSVGDQVTEGQWGEELLDPNRLAVIMAHISAQTRAPLPPHQKVVQTVRTDVDASVILDNSIRLFNGQTLDASLVPESDGQVLELDSETPGHNRQQSKKSLPHKKRISRRLRRNNGGSTPQQELVVISCSEEGHHEEILPDNFVTSVPHHITHEVRPVLICQLCGEFYGEEQLKFFQHLKQHYEPHIIIENPVSDLGMDKMTTCIVDNVATLPDAIVELSLENSVPKTIYQPIDKHVLYTQDKSFVYNNRVQYSVANIDKEQTVEVDKADLYDTLDKLELFNCGKCNKSFRKHKQYEAHMKELHNNTKENLQLEDMGEFSEPEDLMEGIHVAVDEPPDCDQHLLPHLAHAPRHWYGRGNWTYCGCGNSRDRQEPQHLKVLKEEVLQRILETEVANDSNSFSDNIMTETNEIPENEPPTDTAEQNVQHTEPPEVDTNGPKIEAVTNIKCEREDKSKKKGKCYQCQTCNRVFQHRNSLFYHSLSHSGKNKVCRDCGKGFYTSAALKIHRRVHNGDKPYKCDECDREFRQWNDLKNHKVSIHTNQKMFKCEFCNKEFARKYSLNVHRRIHTGERNYKCEICNKCFRASSYRLTHMRTHTGHRPHKCSQCDKCFGVAADLRRHMLVHDKVRNRNNAPKTKLKDNKPIPIKCEDFPTSTEITEITEPPQKIKKIAVASTTKMPTQQKHEKKPAKSTSKKNQSLKKPPNVSIDQIDKSFTEPPNYSVKEIQYSKEFNDGHLEQFEKPILDYKSEHNTDKDFATLRPIFKTNMISESGVDKSAFRTENTDGKMTVYTHIEKNKDFINSAIVPASQMSLSDIRNLERDVRSEITGDGENGFIERLTALYNIPAV